MKIVLASNNTGKLAEIQHHLASFPHEIIPQSQLNLPEAEETGLSFVENALIKARQAASLSGCAALADDSGLSVLALNGAPGIYSARFAGQGASDQANMDKLLSELKDVPDNKRDAFFFCCIVFMRHANDPCPIICEGRWHGRILLAAEGDGGFGYDPVFYVESHHCTAAMLSKDQKNAISHRGIALAKLQQRMIDECI